MDVQQERTVVVDAAVTAEQPARQDGRVLDDAGMSTAEYAVGTVAAVAFAAALFRVVSSGSVRGLLGDVVERALTVPF